MGWIKLDDAFLDHRKFLAAGPLAGYLNIAAMAWSNRNRTNGFIPRRQVRRLVDFEGFACEYPNDGLIEADPLDLAAQLVLCKLWKPEGQSGFVIHDYLEWQNSAEEIDQLSKVRSEAGKRGGQARAKQVAKQTSGKTEAKSKQKEEVRRKKQITTEESPLSADDAPLSFLLADLIAQNGSRRPRVGKAWSDAERLLLERDERDRSEAERLIRWCQGNEFWRANILSMPKFRQQYDRLRLQANASNVTPIRSTVDRSKYDAKVVKG